MDKISCFDCQFCGNKPYEADHPINQPIELWCYETNQAPVVVCDKFLPEGEE